MGLATVGGLGIVFLAIMIDRISQSFGTSARERGHRRWYETGPIGAVRAALVTRPDMPPAKGADADLARKRD
jgi:glycine betaine/proline transport system permease protein